MCLHSDCYVDADSTRTFSHSVATIDENRAAHGGVCEIEVCRECGDERPVNSNGCHSEFGPWGPSRKVLAAQAELAAKKKAAAAMRAREDAAWTMHQASIVHVDRSDSRDVWCVAIVDGRWRTLRQSAIAAAATQHDNGDELVPFYSAMLRHLHASPTTH